MHFKLRGHDRFVVFSRTIFLGSSRLKSPKASPSGRLPFRFDMGPALYPAMSAFAVDGLVDSAVVGLENERSSFLTYCPGIGVYQAIFRVNEGSKKTWADYKSFYDYLISKLDDESSGIYGNLRSVIGRDARFSWACSIDLVEVSDGPLDADSPTGLVGPFLAAASEDARSSDSAVVKVGPTGSYCHLPSKQADELESVFFWLGHAHFSFANLHETIRKLMDAQSTLSEAQQLAPREFHRFIRSKVEILNVLSRVEPQVLGSRWIDFAVYDRVYKDWDISQLKSVCLELVDRTESIVESLENIRLRRNSFMFSLLLNIITFAGLFGVLAYFWDFANRQEGSLARFGVSAESFVAAEPFGVMAIVAIAALFALASLLRDR